MKYFAILFMFVWSANVSALTLKDIAEDESLAISNSRGPKYRKALEEHALEEWWNVDDLYNLIDDGLIHDVYEGECDPDVYRVDDLEVSTEDTDMHVVFDSIKKGSKSIAYVAYPVVTYTVEYSVYKTHADYKKNKTTEMTIDCDVSSGRGFYYEHNKKGEVIYLGTVHSLSELRVQEPEAPKYGVLINGKSVEKEAAAMALYKELKAAEDTDADVEVCYFGNWEQAVDSAHKSIQIGVIDVYSAGELEVEIQNTKTEEYTYGLIREC